MGLSNLNLPFTKTQKLRVYVPAVEIVRAQLRLESGLLTVTICSFYGIRIDSVQIFVASLGQGLLSHLDGWEC